MKWSLIFWILWCALLAALSISGLYLVAAIVFVGGLVVGWYFESQTTSLAIRNGAIATRSDVEDDPEFLLNATDMYLEQESGWDHWTVFPKQQRLRHQDCYGGPPVNDEVYEYEVRGTSLFVRLIERSQKGFEERKYEVFNGQIVQAQLEENYKEQVELWDDASEETKTLMLSDKTPAVVSTKLNEQLAWHERFGAVRYFVFSKGKTDASTLRFLAEEYYRLEKAFATVAKQAEKLGAFWDAASGSYKAPKGADSETKEAVQQIRWDAGLLRFGIRRLELRQRNLIMAILGEATGQVVPSQAVTTTRS